MSVASFISYTYYNPLPTNMLFELMLLVSLLLLAKKMHASAWLVVAGCFLYITYTFAIAYFHLVHLQDYLLAYKSFIYMMILAFFSGKCLFTKKQVLTLFNALLWIFLCKYIIWLVFSEIKRPGVFVENNFEIMTMLFISLAVWSLEKKLTTVQWVLLTLIIFMSGSRSGVVSYFAMIALLSIHSFNFKTFLKLFPIGMVGIGVIAVLVSRLSGGDVSAIDRVVFAQGFLFAIEDWGWLNFLFGSTPLTALPESVCDRLVFYESLFSAKDPSVCYSVILHSYIMRQVFDHGVFGLFIVFFIINHLMKISLVPSRARKCVLAILFLNGMSVSSINSVYAVVGLVVILTTFYPHRYAFEKTRLTLQRKAVLDSQ
ncbi:hypothetical protein PAUR_a3086 [Pseudoalteromonas aurantia 208]|uniref:O-antigen ligase domain-containing protein n=2 Tax=Pseudoalteromonas aurantia TaxID=43654 RepID=A0ABR9EE56_9GAMM|nr:hypothetical protein [Pseudoalteromonas aurantia 208]